jgi:hypothetical protein
MNNMQKTSEMFNYHNDNHDSEYNTPVLFEKKSKQNLVKSLSHINSDTGKTRHFTPAAQE